MYEKWRSQTYGELSIEEIPEKIKEYYERNKHYDTPISIVIGTDSQNFNYTKEVSVIAILTEGHGGIFFYNIRSRDRIVDVRQKLHTETQDSLTIADMLLNKFETKEYEEIFLNTTFTIHIDAGTNEKGKTKSLIPELCGWVKALGFDVKIKPDSYAASSIADKLSK